MPNLIDLERAFARIQDIKQSIQKKIAENPNGKIILTLEQDGEADDITCAFIYKLLFQDPRIAKINIILDEGSKDYKLSYADKWKFYSALAAAEPGKINLIKGSEDKESFKEKRWTLTEEVVKAFDEADIVDITGPAVGLLEYMCRREALNLEPKQFVLVSRLGAVNDDWSINYIAAHLISADEKQKYSQKEDKHFTQKLATQKFEKMFRESAQNTVLMQNKSLWSLFGEQKLNGSKISEEFNSVTPTFYPLFCALIVDAASGPEKWGTELGKMFANCAGEANVGMLEKWGRNMGNYARQEGQGGKLRKAGEPDLAEAFLAELEGKIPAQELEEMKKDLTKYLSITLKKKPSPIISAVCAAQKTIFVPYDKIIIAQRNECDQKINAWMINVDKLKALKQLSSAQEEELAIANARITDLNAEKKKINDEHPHPDLKNRAKGEIFDFCGAVSRYGRVIPFVYHTLVSDQYVAMMMLELFDMMPALLSKAVTEQVLESVTKSANYREVTAAEEGKICAEDEALAFLHFANSKTLPDGLGKKGLINGEKFLMTLHILLMTAMADLLVKPDAPSLALAKPFIFKDLSKLKAVLSDEKSEAYLALVEQMKVANPMARDQIEAALHQAPEVEKKESEEDIEMAMAMAVAKATSAVAAASPSHSDSASSDDASTVPNTLTKAFDAIHIAKRHEGDAQQKLIPCSYKGFF